MKQLAALLLVLFSLATAAQVKQGKARLDSMLVVLQGAQNDTSCVRLLDNIVFAYSSSNPDKGLAYGGKGLAIAQKAGWRRGEALLYNDIGNCYRQKGAYPEALDCFLKALRINEESGDQQAYGMVSGNIGTVYLDQRNYPKALEYMLISLDKAKSGGDRRGELLATGNIGIVYYKQEKYPDALTYMQKALAIAESVNDRRGIINQLGNIGNIYGSLGNNEQAIEWYVKALRIAEQEGDRQIIAANEGNIGETYLDIAKDSAKAGGKAANLSNAVAYLVKGTAAAREVAFNQAVIEFTLTLSEAYRLQGNYEAALAAYQQYTAVKDSTFNLENNEKIAALEIARELELKDRDIKIAQLAVSKKRSERWFFVGGIVLLLAVMGILYRSFLRQRLSNHLLSREKKRSDDLLRNILPDEVAEELKDHGKSAARQYEEVSVLFTDFVNFTAMGESLSPQQLVTELHECFTAFDEIIERNGLEKIKTIGDAYMAVCGLPMADPLHARKAVQAAIEIMDFIEDRRRHERVFEIRAGINTGPVVAGIVGARKFAYDIWGDTVNTAARMEQHGAPGSINISQSTYELVKHHYHCSYRGKVAAKNKGMIDMYFVVPG